MNITITPSKLGGTVKAVPSKSQAHRALICAALCEKPTVIECGGTSKDIEATRCCVEAIRSGLSGGGDAPIILRCGESGSTFRFLLPVVGALGLNAVFELEGRLPERPLTPLYEELSAHGCAMSAQGSNPFHISGRLTSGEYTLDAGVSSQFISGLLFALPLLGGDSELRLTGKAESAPYVDLTVDMIKRFGIELKRTNDMFFIKGNQTYQSAGVVSVEGDWSNAAFWLCAGAISETRITCTGLNPQSKQGDRAVSDILKRFGAKVELSGDAVTVSRGAVLETTSEIEIDASDIPDLVPILSVAAAFRKGRTVISNAERLRIKECDRLEAVKTMLTALSGDVTETADGLIINGGIPLKGGTVNSYNDHRIAMSAAIAATLCEESVTVKDAKAVEKSYPEFFSDFTKLGGVIS